MSTATEEVIDQNKIGKKGFPRHYAALGLAPPTKVVPVQGEEPQPQHPGMTLMEYVAAKRWEKEVSGIDVSGFSVATDDRSKIMISGARIKADKDPTFTTQWKGPDGVFFTIDASTVIAISDAILEHVDSCFAKEAEILAKISSGEITTTAEIDAEFGAR